MFTHFNPSTTRWKIFVPKTARSQHRSSGTALSTTARLGDAHMRWRWPTTQLQGMKGGLNQTICSPSEERPLPPVTKSTHRGPGEMNSEVAAASRAHSRRGHGPTVPRGVSRQLFRVIGLEHKGLSTKEDAKGGAPRKVTTIWWSTPLTISGHAARDPGGSGEVGRPIFAQDKVLGTRPCSADRFSNLEDEDQVSGAL